MLGFNIFILSHELITSMTEEGRSIRETEGNQGLLWPLLQ